MSNTKKRGSRSPWEGIANKENAKMLLEEQKKNLERGYVKDLDNGKNGKMPEKKYIERQKALRKALGYKKGGQV